MIGLLLVWACSGAEPTLEVDVEALRDPATCQGCHPDHFTEWSGSMHAYAAEDPVFRAMNAKGQHDTDGALGDFCVKCHAPVAVELGLTEDGLNLDEVPEELRGVTCTFCHQIDSVEGTHNNPLVWQEDGVMRGGIANPEPNSVHNSAYSALQDRADGSSGNLCGSCHDIVAPTGVHIERTYAEWRESLYGHPDATAGLSCNSCHMPATTAAAAVGGPERRVHSHLFPGVDVALTPFPEMEAQRRAVQEDLDTVLYPDLCVEGEVGDREIRVFLENVAAGHSWPRGATQDRRSWMEVVAYREGAVVFSSGVVADGESVIEAEAADPNFVRFGEVHRDGQGNITHDFWAVEAVETLDVLEAPGMGDPNGLNTRIYRYQLGSEEIDRVELRVRMRPVGLDILDGLASEGYLDASVRDAMPTFDLGSTTLIWSEGLGQPCVYRDPR